MLPLTAGIIAVPPGRQVPSSLSFIFGTSPEFDSFKAQVHTGQVWIFASRETCSRWDWWMVVTVMVLYDVTVVGC